MGDSRVNDGIPIQTTKYRQMGETAGERIKRLRVARGLSQLALAELLISMGGPSTLTKAAVAKWENGDTKNMQNESFILMCKALHTDPEYILWGQNRSPRPSTPSTSSSGRRTG